MSNIIPPLVSSSPPPMVAGEPDDVDDEFGDFRTATSTDFSFEGYSLPTTPQHDPCSNFSTSPISTTNQSDYPSRSPNFDTLLPNDQLKVNENFVTESTHDKEINNEFSEKSSDVNINSDDNKENIFCDIKNDVNVHTIKESSFVNNKSIENNDISCTLITNKLVKENDETFTNDVENIENSVFEQNYSAFVPTSNTELEPNENSKTTAEKPENLNDHCDIQIAESISNNLNKNELNVSQNNIINENNFNHENAQDQVEDLFDDFKEFSSSKTDECIIKNNDTELLSSDSANNLNQYETEKSDELTFNENAVEKQVVSLNEELYSGKELKLSDENESALFNHCKQMENSEMSNQVSELKTCVSDASENDTVLAKIDENNSSYVETFNNVIGEKDEILNNDNEDDFGDFSNHEEFAQTSTVETVETNNVFVIKDDDDFGEFSNFTEATVKIEEVAGASTEMENASKSEDTENAENIGDDDFDDFGDFNDYSTGTRESSSEVEFVANFDTVLESNEKKAEEVVKEIFDDDDELKQSECETIDFTENKLFRIVQDIENTFALSYQWTDSESQKILLKALNIDTRNILFGSRWNASMPRFAANLGFVPLEPVKTEITSASTSADVTTPVDQQQVQCDVPAAKFDWTSSGLVNPLESHIEPIKLETVEEKLSRLENEAAAANAQLDLNIFGNLSHSDNESVNSLKFIEASIDIENDSKLDNASSSSNNNNIIIINNSNNSTNNQSIIQTSDNVANDDYDNFTSYQFETTLPETHITNTNFEIPVPTVPTSKTEILSVTTVSTTPSVEIFSTQLNTVEHNPLYENDPLETSVNVSEQVPADDDEFTDFQMSLPQTQIAKPTPIMVGLNEPLTPLQPLQPIVISNNNNNNNNSSVPTQINWPQPGIINDDLDEFEFNYTNISNNVASTATTITSTVVSTATSSSSSNNNNDTTISNSVPITTISSSSVSTPILTPVIDNKPKQHKQREINAPEEDDWSDFVSADSNKIAASVQPLSVPNLQQTRLSHATALPPVFGQTSSPTRNVNSHLSGPSIIPSTQQLAAQQIGNEYQPPYQIPLNNTINTPFGGLPQTSLSSYSNFSTIGPTELTTQSAMQQGKFNNVPTVGLFDGPFHAEMKQFQSHSHSQNNHHTESLYYQQQQQQSLQMPLAASYQLNSIESTFLKMQQPSSTANAKNVVDDDDDWSDFVSSKPVMSTQTLPSYNNTMNGLSVFSQHQTNSKSLLNNFTPNIISNPVVNFEAFQSPPPVDSKNVNHYNHKTYEAEVKSKNTSVPIPSISALPELDFIAPKPKFFSKKK